MRAGRRIAFSAGSLSHYAARGAAVTLSGQAARISLQLVSIVVLARILTPEDFGLIAMVTVFIGLGELVRDFGLSNAAIQSPELSKSQRDALFWTNTAIGVLLAGVLFVLAGPIADWFASPPLVTLVQWLAGILIVNALATQHRASLTRDMRFRALVVCDLVPQTIGLAAAVTVGILGYGVTSLVVQQYVIAILGLVSVMIAGGWLPTIPRRPIGIRPFLNYGTNLLLAEIFIYASKNVDTVVLGVRTDAFQLGLYNRAFQMLMVPLMQVNAPLKRVALPTLSRLQNDPQRFARYLVRAQLSLALPVVLMLAFAAAMALPLVWIVLGPDWIAVAPVFQILAIGGAFHVVTYAVSWIFISRALTKSYFRYTVVARSMMVAFIVAGGMFDVEGVAVGYSVGLAAQWPIALWWTRNIGGVPSRILLANGVRVLTLGLLTATPGLIVCTFVQPFGILLNLLAGTLASASALALCIWVLPSVRRDLKAVVDTARRMKSSSGPETNSGET